MKVVMRTQKISIRVFLSITALFAFTATNVFGHKYYFGNTIIELNEKNNHLEVIHEYSTHDLEYALTAMTNEKVNLEKKEGVEKLRAYISDNFKMTTGGNIVKLNWVGMELDHNLVTVYQESSVFKGEELTLYNSLLISQFPSQINLADLRIKGIRKSLRFDKRKNVYSISLNKE